VHEPDQIIPNRHYSTMDTHRIKEIGWTLAMLLGIYSIIEFLASARFRSSVDWNGPWYLVPDALHLFFWFSIFKLWSCQQAADATPWLWLSLLSIFLRFAWAWRWGFCCFPRRTRIGRCIDQLLGDE
jgi:signal transduction histidine kinase